jgi:hypothetical protein
MYTIIPKNLLATAYDIYYDNKLVAHLKKPTVSIKDNCNVLIGGKQFDFRRQGVVSGDWILETLDHITVASAVKPGVFSDTFVIHFDNNELTLKAKFLSLKNECILFDKDRQIGNILQANFFSRKLHFTVNKEVPLEIIVFIVCIALVVIDRKSASTST